jgi:hypothetical protein
LRDTVEVLSDPAKRERYRRLATENLQRWRSEAEPAPRSLLLELSPEDWGEATARLSRRFGTTFAVLNMANAYVPGGAYVEGAVAQEENLFRRSDCHFSITEHEYDAERDRYHPFMTELLSAVDGRVYLDVEDYRICIRGPEFREREDLGYRWLEDDEVFPFFELRAAAQDLRGQRSFDPEEARRRIAAQLDTLREHGVRHAVLSAFGCGAFQNPAEQVAALYRDEIEKRRSDFAVLTFAIYYPGYGRDNFAPFVKVLG